MKERFPLLLVASFLQGAVGASEDDGVCLYNLPQPPCSCGGAGQWTRIAHLDMSDPTQQCPINWQLTSSPVRGCGRSTNAAACDSAIFPTEGLSYSHVCGRVNGYQFASPDAFFPTHHGAQSVPNDNLEGVYVDGVSLTHGAAGSRQHIWTFAATATDSSPHVQSLCACNIGEASWPYHLPSFVNNSYFCATGNRRSDWEHVVYSEDPLWDGEGCGGTTCCQLNNPPWFCTTLAAATTDALELRICFDQGTNDENVIVSSIDIYVM